jgi:hypothetical protein
VPGLYTVQEDIEFASRDFLEADHASRLTDRYIYCQETVSEIFASLHAAIMSTARLPS